MGNKINDPIVRLMDLGTSHIRGMVWILGRMRRTWLPRL